VKSNYLFILKTYWQYGKRLMIIAILYAVIVMPINTLVTVLLTQHVTDAVASGYSFDHVMTIIIRFASVLIGTIVVGNIYETYSEIARTKIRQKINLDIYKKSYETDYQLTSISITRSFTTITHGQQTSLPKKPKRPQVYLLIYFNP